MYIYICIVALHGIRMGLLVGLLRHTMHGNVACNLLLHCTCTAGGFAATFLGFILPAACWLHVQNEKAGKPCWGIFEWDTLNSGQKMGALFTFIFGMFAMIISTSLTLINQFNPPDKPAPHPLDTMSSGSAVTNMTRYMKLLVFLQTDL